MTAMVRIAESQVLMKYLLQIGFLSSSSHSNVCIEHWLAGWELCAALGWVGAIQRSRHCREVSRMLDPANLVTDRNTVTVT